MQPKFKLEQKVKFINDHDRMTGKVIEFKWDSTNGYTYTISSKYYDIEKNDMVDGIKICREAELQDMTNYTGVNDPIKADTTVSVEDKVEPAK